MSQMPSAANPPSGNVKLVIVAVVLAVLAVILVNVFIGLDRSGRTGKEIEIYRLNVSVRPGDKFNSSMDVTAHLVNEKYRNGLGKGLIVGVQELANRNGKRFLRQAEENTVLTHSLFTEAGDTPMLLTPNMDMRLIPIAVNSRKAPGLLRPGSYVDIEAPFNIGGRIPLVLPVMEKVKVWAVGRRVLGEDNSRAVRGYQTITIEVKPTTATQLSMVEKLAVGNFELHLRDPADNEYPKTGGADINPRVIELVEKALGRSLPR